MVRLLASIAFFALLIPSAVIAGKDFIKEDLRNKPIRVAQLVGENLSRDYLTFVVHGGARELQLATYEVAQRLDDEGIPIAFIIGANSDDNIYTALVQFFSKGGTQYSVLGFNDGDMESFKKMLGRKLIRYTALIF